MVESEAKPGLLIIEDDLGLQSQLRWSFDGYDVAIAGDRATALAALEKLHPPVITLDLGLPPDPANASVGLALLEEIMALAPRTKVIVVTGNDDHQNAVLAVAKGAYDYYQKPIDIALLSIIINRAYRLYRLENDYESLRSAQREEQTILGLIGNSRQIQEVIRTVEKVANTEASVLLLGESGTGKELIARGIHQSSGRRYEEFIAINCAAIPGELLESELFGSEKGAFTGASKQTRGKIEYADRGTLFLDEIGDLPMPLQAKLLRFLQERVIERIGGREEIAVDVRVICATHQNLGKLIAAGAFREDLYYRISEVAIHIPPLRDREGDAVMLAKTFLDRQAAILGKKVAGFTKEALAAINKHPWKGNVRELENVITRAAIMTDRATISLADLRIEAADEYSLVGGALHLKEVRERAEKAAIIRALVLHNGKITAAAKALGISRPTLYDLQDKYGIDKYGGQV